MSELFVEGRRQTDQKNLRRKLSRLFPGTGRSQAANLETQKQTKWIEMHQSQGLVFPKRSATMIDGTEKPKIPSKFAKRAAGYNEFGYKDHVIEECEGSQSLQ